MPQLTPPNEPAALGALQQTASELTPTVVDLTGQNGISSILTQPTPESQGITSVIQASGVLRIIFKLP